MTPPPLIDRAVLDELSRIIGAQGTRTVLALFVVECRGYLATIAEAGAQPADPGHRERARRAAHSLKSCAGQIGAAALSATAAAVELAAGDPTRDLAEAAASLHQCAEDSLSALAPLQGG